MKKITILLLSLVILLCGCGKEAAPTEPPLQETEEIVEVTGPEAILDPEDMTEPLPTETVLRLVRKTALTSSGSESWHEEYYYDDYGREKLTEEYMEGEVVCSTSITYTDSGRELLYSYPEGRTVTVLETLDEAGNLLSREFIEDGQVEYRTDYTYDEEGRLLSYTTVYTQEGSPLSCSYEYDDQGNQILVYEYTGDQLVGQTQREFDNQGRKVKAVYTDMLSDWGYTYVYTWEGSTETAVQYDSDGTESRKTITAYDESGNILSQETWQDGDMVSRLEYTYEEIEIIVD